MTEEELWEKSFDFDDDQPGDRVASGQPCNDCGGSGHTDRHES